MPLPLFDTVKKLIFMSYVIVNMIVMKIQYAINVFMLNSSQKTNVIVYLFLNVTLYNIVYVLVSNQQQKCTKIFICY